MSIAPFTTFAPRVFFVVAFHRPVATFGEDRSAKRNSRHRVSVQINPDPEIASNTFSDDRHPILSAYQHDTINVFASVSTLGKEFPTKMIDRLMSSLISASICSRVTSTSR